MSLDLAVPWNSTAPAWTKLADSPSQRLFPATFSSDEQTLYVFHIPGSTSPWYYSVKDDVWHELWPVRFQDTNWEGFGAVTDPRTGLVYIAGGYDNANYNANYMRGLDIFDPITLSIHMESLPAPDTLFPMRWYYANVWSKARNSVVYWGGINKKVNMPFSSVENGVTALFTDTWSWYTLDGTKVAVYGGRLRNGTTIGEIWILDLVTLTWAQGQSGPPRMYAACAIAGDQLLIWGGSAEQTVLAPSDMLIYNLKTSSYVQQYTPPPGYKDLKPPPPLTRTTALWATQSPTSSTNAGSGTTNGGSTDSGSAPSGSNAAIVGGVVGGLSLMGAFAGVLNLWSNSENSNRSGSS
ncbi:Acyl-CoA-binding domain-containing protein 5 [Linnemannia gamsii]|uniref:Acyl-CoA-binding domain-containing protein 5 n=1 Tax=Linnemannia gamsii TaxID=64522 RepID=A0A9P6URV8_9FUNG|nr:Acyl-CoA-binding domain-containing protein 5 [Linnemannia gamsii]